ncbi:MAG: ABC transporter permease [Bacteroidetes bacterium]|nr:ABC transporter permease [Bacteroidota bacterium]
MKDQSTPHPPRFSNWVLSWLLDDDWETPVGDFEEAFHHMAKSEGYPKARRWYRVQVLRLFPERLFEQLFWSVYMLRTNLKLTIRSLRKNPVFAAINIGGLAIGMAAFLLIALFIQNELAFDTMYSKSDNLVRVVETVVNGDGTTRIDGYTRAAVGPEAMAEIPEVEGYVRLLGQSLFGRGAVTTSTHQFYEGEYYFAEPAFFENFDLPFLTGDPATALTDPNTVVLTESAAIKYFGTTDALGKELEAERRGTFTVTAVLKDLPDNTHLSFNLLYSMSSMGEAAAEVLADWENSGMITYLRLKDGASIPDVESKLAALFSRRLESDASSTTTPNIQTLKEVHFGSAGIENEDNAHEANFAIIGIFGLVAALIVLIAVINYTNMTTAGSMKRAKEVGLRKAVGAHRGQLMRQFFGESFVTIFLAVILALILANVALPGFNAVMGKSLKLFGTFGIQFLGVIVLMLVGIGMLSSIFPAISLASAGTVTALKGRPETRAGAPRLRQVLVTAQFTLSIGLIISSLIVLSQMRFIQETDLGFKDDQLLIVDINSGDVRRDFRTILTEYRAVSGVRDVTVSSRVPGDWKPIAQIDARNGNSGPESIVGSHFLGMDDRFLDTYGMTLIEGRNLSMETTSDSLSVLINETAAKAMNLGIGDPVSISSASLLRRFPDSPFVPVVVGIVKDFNFQSLHQQIGPMILGFHRNPIQSIDYFTIKLVGGPVPEVMEQLEAIGRKFDPERPWEFNFLDSRLEDFYQAETRFTSVFSLATGLAILIACLGLLGLTTFTVVRRTKEIGIRKVFGSSSAGIVTMLSKEIATLVVISFTIAAPVSWLIMNRWLNDFAYHTEINLLTIVLSGVIALLCALGTVSFQSFRASRMNPVQCLRYE